MPGMFEEHFVLLEL